MTITANLTGFQLYKEYIYQGETARRYTPEWHYSRLLTEALQLVGVTRLFDMLEEAERTKTAIELVYPPYTDSGLLAAYDIRLADSQPVRQCEPSKEAVDY